MTASVPFADSSPLLQNAPKAPRLYHGRWPWTAQLRVILQPKLCNPAQLVKTPEHISRRRHVHGLRASMHHTFDGTLDTPSKPSSHRAFLSSENMQITDLWWSQRNSSLSSTSFRDAVKGQSAWFPPFIGSSGAKSSRVQYRLWLTAFSWTKLPLHLCFRSLRQTSSQWLSGLPSPTAACQFPRVQFVCHPAWKRVEIIF